MVKTNTYTAPLGVAPGAAGSYHYLSTYNAKRIVVNAYVFGSTSVGQLTAGCLVVKPFVYPDMLYGVSGMQTGYFFSPPDTGATAHEYVSGAAMVIGGGGITANNWFGALRYQPYLQVLASNSNATLVGNAYCTLALAENAGIGTWSIDFWVLRLANTAATLYLETNAGTTQYLQIIVNATGTISITHSGAVVWTSTYVIPLGTAVYVGLQFGGGVINTYVNGAINGAGIAYVPTATWGLVDRVIINQNANSVLIIGGVATYRRQLLGDEFSEHYFDLVTDAKTGVNLSTAANLSLYQGCGVIFTNEIPPQFISAAQTLILPLTPVVYVYNTAGLFMLDVTTYYEDTD